ncbi:MAG TPA: UDP-N-acetylmuramoyl-L-alanine--D-glutamate ligase [Candidatus Mailhella excrementigallinarum]|nr:UDP-N-acetylmuramoyl-L-alanine--D-glutamate ligase [Candidatus Mailhella excrementigallinarum]
MTCNPALLTPINADTSAIVVGGGRSGQAAARLLRRLGATVRLLERNAEKLPGGFTAWAASEGVEILGGEHRREYFLDADILIPSPGAAVSMLRPLLTPGEEPEIMAETELAWRQLEGEPVLAVTGTSGKTTTISMCAAMLEAQGLNVFLGGNIGTPLSEYVLARAEGRPRADVLALELSSFQLQTCTTLRPRVAVLLNISANHLDYHKDMKEYIEAKMRLFRCQDASCLAVFGPGLRGLPERMKVSARTGYFDPDSGRFPDMQLIGPHNHANAEAAWQACREFGVTLENARRAMQRFKPLPHRLERIAEKDGVLYVNDSKCTTVEALKVALASFERPVLLLAGGRFKGGDLAGLAPLLKRHVKAAGLYGASREVFENAWKDILPTSWDETLRLALARLRGMARPGDVVLLAPATSSYDQYENYRERGDDFRRAVLEQD